MRDDRGGGARVYRKAGRVNARDGTKQASEDPESSKSPTSGPHRGTECCILKPTDMGIPTKSTFALYVVWHERYSEGRNIADCLLSHFAADRFCAVTPGARVRVSLRRLPSESAAPNLVEWNRAGTTAVVVLYSEDLVQDPESLSSVREVSREAERVGLTARVIPVVIGDFFPEGEFEEQGIRWDQWTLPNEVRREKLIRALAHEFILMLRHQLLDSPRDANDLTRYREKISVFLSYSKHDEHGEIIANQIRDWIDTHTKLASFIDSRDIVLGVPFEKVVTSSIKDGVLLAVRTDSYSSREWCCREVLLAKQYRVPMIVIDCLRSHEDRAFPYLGNVPTIRMEPNDKHRIASVIGHLLDEIFMHYLWRCRTNAHRDANPGTLFLPRPPELASLSSLNYERNQGGTLIVYPDPPMMSDETRLFGAIRSDVTLRSFSQWTGSQSS